MTTINLAALPRPEIPGLVLELDDVHAAILASLQEEFGWRVGADASDPAWRLTRAIAGREVLLRQAVADAVAELSLAYATGPRLDVIAATYYGLGRLESEADDALRHRLAAAPERYAVGLSGPWYESVARGVPGVSDAAIESPRPGTVRIHILADETLAAPGGGLLYANGIPSSALLDDVRARVTAPETRQQTDTVEVVACTRQRYDINLSLTLIPGPAAAIVESKAAEALMSFGAAQQRLNAAVTTELIAGACVDTASVLGAVITIRTVSSTDQVDDVDLISRSPGIAPQPRHLTVTT